MSGKKGFIFIIAMVFWTAPLLYGDVNVLSNPGFETADTSPWAARGSGSCTINVSTSSIHAGSYSCIASNRTATWNGVKQSILGLINTGQTCTMSGYVKLAGSTTSDTVKLSVERTDSSGTKYYNIATATVSNSAWIYLSGTFTLSATGTLTTLDIYFEGPASGVSFYLDDAAVMVPESVETITGQIDPSVSYQTIEGFGAAGAWYGGWLTAHPQKAQLYDLLFNQLDLDIYRIRNTYQLSDSSSMNTDAAIITAAEAVMGRPLKIMLSSWSPPASLKSNNSTVAGTLAKDTSGNYAYDAFAQWWIDSLNAYADLGIVADYINMQNEPDYLATWDSCKFTATETTSYAGYNLAFAALAEIIDTVANPPKLLAPEAIGFGTSENYIDALLDKTPLYAYAHHLYGDGSGSTPDGYIAGMTAFAATYNDKPRMQTEFSNTDDTGVFADALNLAILMHNSLTAENVSVYMYWDLFWGTSPSGLITLDNPWTSNPGYTIQPAYYAFKHYSAFIDPDWRRIETSSSNSNLRISAYASPDNHSMTAVIVNPSASLSYNLTFTPNQFDFTNGNIYRSSNSQNCVLIGNFTPAEPITIPTSSITTITMAGAIIPSTCVQVQDFGYRLDSDLNGDCQVEIADLLLLADQWLSTPSKDQTTYSPDITSDNNVDLADFSSMAQQWLVCNDPTDTTCVQNW